MNRKQQSLVALAALVLGALMLAGCGSSTETPDNTVAASINGNLPRIADSALEHRLPSICGFVPRFAEAAGLLAYGPLP